MERLNHSAARLDNQMQLKHNDLHEFRVARIAEANAEAAAKGRTTKYRSSIATRAQCAQAGHQYKCFADTELVPANFVHPDCPTSRSTQRIRSKQVTAMQRQRAEETLDIMETWAAGANREDKADEEWCVEVGCVGRD